MADAGALSSISSTDEAIQKVLPLVHEAGNPYFDFLFGNHDVAARVLARWMRRPSSELSIERAFCLTVRDQQVGGFLAMSGAELAVCRRLDTSALTMTGGREQREAIVKRLELTRHLFPPVEERDFYLSKIWVDPEHRGAGYGRALMESYVSTGRARGFTQFRLDVRADNEPAIHVYRFFGFKELRESSTGDAGLRYLAMVANISPR